MLIIAPVLVLAAVGGFSVWQDSTLARHEASDRAQAVAEELLPKLRSELFTRAGEGEHEFQMDSSGRLIFPPPYSAVPIPHPFDLGLLSTKQAELWRSAQAAEGAGAAPADTARAYLDFLQSEPPPEFSAAARYAAGVLLARAGDLNAAAMHLAVLLEKFPDAVGESGLPLRPLAEVRLLELLNRGVRPGNLSAGLTVDGVCSNLVYQPTALTPHLLQLLDQQMNTVQERTQVRDWLRTWSEQDICRVLFSSAESQLRTPAAGSELRLLSLGSRRELETTGTHLFWFHAPGAREGVPPTVEFADTRAEGLDRPARSVVPLPGESDWLAIQTEDGSTRYSLVCRSEWSVGMLAKHLVETWKHLPEYLGVGVEVAGKKLTWPAPDLRVWHEVHYLGGKGMGQVRKEYTGEMATKVLGSASSPADQLKVSVYLTSPTALYKYQRVRTFWFGALITAAAVAALVGLIAAYRAFHRQLRLSELKSDFVSSVSHELRAPIASVRLMAESLERGKVADPERQKEYFHFIDQECRRLSSLIENVLDFSRIEQGRKRYDFEPTDLLALTRHTVQLMDTYAAERRVRLSLVAPGDQLSAIHYQLSADGKALQQALINLIHNSIKHSPLDAVVTIGLELDTRPATGNLDDDLRIPENGSRLLVWVEDHGPGIPPAEHEKIFERFYRRGAELRRETQGVGIGLSIVKHIVEAHGGRVVVRSDVGQGSRFTIELPVLNSEDTKQEIGEISSDGGKAGSG